MKRAAPLTTRALASLAMIGLLTAGVVEGARCEMEPTEPCCTDTRLGPPPGCCSTVTDRSLPAVAAGARVDAPARAIVFVDLSAHPPALHLGGAPAARVDRHPPPSVLRI